MLPDIKVTVIEEEGVEQETTLRGLCAGKIGVIDFWHTKCIRCPAALDKFDSEFEKLNQSGVSFIACAISQGTGNKEEVAELGPE